MHTSVSSMDVLFMFVVLLFAFGFPLIIAFLIYYYGEICKPLEFAKMGKYEEFAKAKMTREREVIVKEIVMIPCQYCGGPMPQTATSCPGAGLEMGPKRLRIQESLQQSTCVLVLQSKSTLV